MAAENEEPESPVKKNSVLKRKVKIWVAVVLSVLVFVLIIQNRHPVDVRLFFWEFKVAGIILLPFVFLVGIVVGYVVRRKH